MIASAAALDAAIDSLSAGEFQELAERFAQIGFPERFGMLAVHGRNSSIRTVAGWPDAYATRADGRIDAVEATRDSRNWRTHLRNDIEHVASYEAPFVAGLLFVAWAPAPSPGALHVERRALVDAGLDPASVNFVFRADLVTALRSPRYASVWQHLGLPASSWPFATMAAAPIFGDGNVTSFAPTQDEIRRGVVHTPSVINDVTSTLDSRGWVLVLGRGGSGKTVLAALLGIKLEDRRLPCYYLDLAPLGEALASSNTVFEFLSTRAATDVLFIVDNVHRYESFAAAIYEHWRQCHDGSRLLLLGRDVASGSGTLGLAAPLARVKRSQPYVVIRVERQDLLGVWRRLDTRSNGSARTGVPSSDVLDAWLQLFGGDLIAFSAAIAFRKPSPKDWSLQAGDARNYIETRYLSSLQSENRIALLAVAHWSSIELSLPASPGLEIVLARPIADGIVERTAAGYDGFRMVHPGLASLVMAASGDESHTLVLDAINDVPEAVAVEAARRILACGEDDVAARCLDGRVEDASALIRLLLVGGAKRIPSRSNILGALLAPAHIENAWQSRAGVEHELRRIAPDELVGLLAQKRVMPGVTVAILHGWLGLDKSDRRRLAVEIATFAAAQELRHAPLIFRWIRSGLPPAHREVVDAFAEQGGVELFFSKPRNMPLPRWEDFEAAATTSASFRARLFTALDGQQGAVWPLLRSRDALKLLDDLEATAPAVCAALASQVECKHFHDAVLDQISEVGCGRFLSMMRLTGRLDRTLQQELVSTCHGDVWNQRVVGWVRSAPTKYAKLDAWASDHLPALESALRMAEVATSGPRLGAQG